MRVLCFGPMCVLYAHGICIGQYHAKNTNQLSPMKMILHEARWCLQGGASGGYGRGSRSQPEPEHSTQPYFPAQPAFSPYGQPQQRAVDPGPPADVATASGGRGRGQRRPAASAWDYPAQPPPAQVVDLTRCEDVTELE